MIRYLIILFFLIQGHFQVNAQTTDNEWYLTALGAFQQENLEKAKKAFTQIRDLEPEMCHLKARVYLASNQPDSAIHILKDMNMPESVWLKALCYADKNLTNDAIQYLQQYLKFNKKRTEAEIKLHPGFESLSGSTAWKELWLEEWYSHHENTIAEVKYLLEQENFFAAIDTLSAKVKKFPEYADYFYYLAKAYNQIGKHEQALDYIEKAVEMERTVELYRLQRANIQYALKDWEEAIDDYTYYLRLHPGEFNVYLKLADTYAKNEESHDAIRELDEYLSYLPLDQEALKLKANIAYNSGDYLTALSTINLYFKHHKPKAESYKLRGKAYYHANMAEYAEKDFSQALDFNPNDADVYYYRGMSRIKQNKLDPACADFKKSYQLGSRKAYNQLQEHCE